MNRGRDTAREGGNRLVTNNLEFQKKRKKERRNSLLTVKIKIRIKREREREKLKFIPIRDFN